MWHRCSSSDTKSSWFWMVEVKFTNFCDPLATRSSAGTSDSDEEKSQTELARLTLPSAH